MVKEAEHLPLCISLSISGKIPTEGLAFSFFDTPASIER